MSRVEKKWLGKKRVNVHELKHTYLSKFSPKPSSWCIHVVTEDVRGNLRPKAEIPSKEGIEDFTTFPNLDGNGGQSKSYMGK